MMRRGMKWIMVLVICMVGIFGSSRDVCATELAYLTASAPQITGYVELPTRNEDGTAVISWWNDIYLPDATATSEVSYEIEVAKDNQFTNATKFETTQTSYTLPKSVFGTNGGTYYVRVRTCVNADTQAYSDWSTTAEYVFVAINKKNFPGLYKVLKNGSKCYSDKGVMEEIYDLNGDGWLDPAETDKITSINSMDVTVKKKGKKKTVKAPTVTSVKGIEYLNSLSLLCLERYTGTRMDLSNNTITYVHLSSVKGKQFTLIAPDAKNVYVYADDNVKMKKIDVSKCNKAVDIDVDGNSGTKIVKLPKTKTNLKVLRVADIKLSSLDMNAYKNLQQLYVVNCPVKKVSVNKCKDLRYIYFVSCDKIKSLNLKSNKKLRGADYNACPGLTKKTVKRPKNGKCTWNKGIWWLDTAKYKKDMEKIYQ